ncbi:MAG: hypothetical protein AAFX54_15080 [Pseudomonadota bacterium]
MAEDASHQRITPPRAASALLALALRGSTMAPLLGDLDEEYAEIAEGSPKAARRWYWRQSVLSTAHVIAERARQEHLHRALLGVAAVFVFLHYWNLWIAPGAATQVYALSDVGSYGPARIAYFIVAILGAGAAGAFFSRVAATARIRLIKFILTRAGPAALLLFAPASFEILTAGEGYPVVYRLSQTGLAAGSFIAGAAIAFPHARRP